MPTIGLLGLGSVAVAERRVASLRAGLRDLGLSEPQDYRVELRAIGGDYTRLRDVSDELIRTAPSVLVGQGTPGTAALKSGTASIPIVMVSGDAIATGLIESLSRPGGNVTGLTFFSPELMAKRLEILKEALPEAQSAGVLLNAANALSGSLIDSLRAVGRTLNIELYPELVRTELEIQSALVTLLGKRAVGVVVHDDPMLVANSNLIAKFAAERRMLTVGYLELVESGGTISYGVDLSELYYQLAQYMPRSCGA